MFCSLLINIETKKRFSSETQLKITHWMSINVIGFLVMRMLEV